MSQMSDLNDPLYLRLSVQRAMVGLIPANLAGLRATLKGSNIVLEAYYFDSPSEDDLELISEVATEVIADYTAEYNIEEQIRLRSELKLDQHWDFLRSEACN
jgi:hypothetical protein